MKHPLNLKAFMEAMRVPITKEQMAAAIKERDAEGAASKAQAVKYAQKQAKFQPAKKG